jgi:hypothetical protein
MVFCVRKLNWKWGSPQLKRVRNYTNYEPKKFCQDLKNVNWSSVNPEGVQYTDQCHVTGHKRIINEQWLSFVSVFFQVADRHAPLIQKRVRGLDNCPWLTGEIKRNIRQRDHLLKKAKKSNCVKNWANYHRTRNRVKNCIRKTKDMYNQRLVENDSNGTQCIRSWNTMHKILPKDNKSDIKGINIDNEHCLDDQKIANDFNTFFTGAADRLSRMFRNVLDSPGLHIHTHLHIKQIEISREQTMKTRNCKVSYTTT